MPNKPATRQAKKKQTKPVSSSNKRAKPDLLVVDNFPQLGKPTFVQKDKFTGVNMPVFI
jgi:predicted glycosyltransferase